MILSLMLLAHAGARQGFLLQVIDPGGYVQAPLQVTVRGDQGSQRVLRPLDDGAAPDMQADDGTYTCPVPSFPDPTVDFTLQAGDRTWTGQARLSPDDVKAMVRLQLQPDGRASLLDVPDAPRPEPPPSELASTSTSHVDLGPGWLLWGLLALGLGLGAGLRLFRAQHAPPSRLSPPPFTPIPAMFSGTAEQALGGPLAGHRVVLLGPPQDGCIPCEDPAPLPEELVAAVDALATRPGPPVALLITAPERLAPGGPRPPVEELVSLTGGRFPLVVLQGS